MSAPSSNPDLYASISLNGMRSPGTVTLSGHDRDWSWDIKEAKGQDGASTSRNGEKVAQFTATFSLSDDPLSDVDDFTGWEVFSAMLGAAMKAKAPVAMSVYHPDLARNGITSVVVAGIGGMQHDGKGGATVAVKLLEYRPPKKKPVSGPSGKSSKTSKPGDPVGAVAGALDQHMLNLLKSAGSPNEQAKAELHALEAEASKP
ncbi:MAG: hypothetical protein IT377_27825 [Polyangiaceae bacterium]|nr:hypothetical protein [Polyangiaceae bacterium]